jgi:hypothetical protein
MWDRLSAREGSSGVTIGMEGQSLIQKNVAGRAGLPGGDNPNIPDRPDVPWCIAVALYLPPEPLLL